MTISNFMNKVPPNDSKINPVSSKNPENTSGDFKLFLSSDRDAQKESLLAQVKTLFEAKEPVVDKKWVMTNSQVYQTLYRYVFPTAKK